MTENFDLIVVGSGPAGEKGGAQAAYFGKRVALVERAPHLGGAGVNTGTVPSKTLRETALYFSGLRQRGLYGIDYAVKRDITVPDFMYREREVVHTLRVTAPDRPERRLSASVILLATGSRPGWPEGVPRDPRLYDSDSILQMQRIPRTMASWAGE